MLMRQFYRFRLKREKERNENGMKEKHTKMNRKTFAIIHIHKKRKISCGKKKTSNEAI